MSDGKTTCANCGQEMREGARFCASCGAPLVLPDQQSSSNEPPPPPSTGSTSKRRRRWIVAGVVAALLVAGGAAAALSFTGGGGSNQGAPPGGSEITAPGTSGTDCEQLTSFVDEFARLGSADGAELAATPEQVDEITEAFSELASKAPDDVRQDFETVSETFREMARAVADLGLEPGDIPNEEQTNELLDLTGELLDESEYLEAAFNVQDWLETAVSDCSSSFGTETTDGEDESSVGDATTTDGSVVIGEGVDETCEGLLAFARRTREPNEHPSAGDVQTLAAIASDLASKAPAESSETGAFTAGEPRASLEATAQSLESYARLSAELGLEPGSDEALDEPRIAEAIEGLQDADAEVTRWFEDRCSPEDVAALEQIRNG